MKKFLVFLILFVTLGVFSYKYYHKQTNVYNVSLPTSYDLFEKNMFDVLQKLDEEERNLLINYSLRFKKSPNQLTVREALENEKNFEKTEEGIVFFSKLKEENIKSETLEQINNSIFVTFVDYLKNDTNIIIKFSIKNKTSKAISKVIGVATFNINNETFSTDLELNNKVDTNTFEPLSTDFYEKTFSYSEFPSLKDLTKNSYFKMKISLIEFSDGTYLQLN